VTVTKPLTLDGQGEAEIRGSDVWANWSQSGSKWTSADTVPNMGADSQGAEYIDAFRAAHVEQVFVDGTALTQVPTNPNDSQFALDPARHVVLGTNPSGHTIEVTTRKYWILTGADNVTITNFTLRHAASSSQSHAIGNDNHSNFTISNSRLSDAHGTMLSFGGGDTHASAVNNTMTAAGDLAIGAASSGHARIQGNTIANSGYGGWNWQWQAGGIKMVGSSDFTVDSNTVSNNNGPGIWCDIGCHGAVYSNNKVSGNSGPGILFEISDGARVVGNSVWSNGSQLAGISISNSGDTEIANNTVAWNSIGISVLSAQRSDSQQSTTGNNIHDNSIIMRNSDGHALDWLQYGSGKMFSPDGGNRGGNNHFWYPNGEDGSVRFVWQSGFGKLSDFAGTPVGKGSDYLSNASRDQVLASASIPTTP
jgi:parallel beta-helix repeat protein